MEQNKVLELLYSSDIKNTRIALELIEQDSDQAGLVSVQALLSAWKAGEIQELLDIDEPAAAFHLKKISCSSKQLNELPRWLFALQQVEHLVLNFNMLKELPDAFAKLRNLKQLDAEACHFVNFPEVLLQLPQLATLNLLGNELTELPDWIGELANLKELNLMSNQLETIPASIAQLSKLEKLSLGFNPIQALPPEIRQLSQLKYLYLNESLLNTQQQQQLKTILPQCFIYF